MYSKSLKEVLRAEMQEKLFRFEEASFAFVLHLLSPPSIDNPLIAEAQSGFYPKSLVVWP